MVHADRWSLAVHRSDADLVVRRLMTGNLLASARAALGAPCPDVAPVSYAIYEDDIPESRPLDEGWRLDCVPTPSLSSRHRPSGWATPSLQGCC